MNFYFCSKRFFSVLILLFTGALAFSEQFSSPVLRRFAFEIVRFHETGFSSLKSADYFASSLPDDVYTFLLRKIAVQDGKTKRFSSLFMIEFINPDCIGILDSTFSPDDIFIPLEYKGNEDSLSEEDKFLKNIDICFLEKKLIQKSAEVSLDDSADAEIDSDTAFDESDMSVESDDYADLTAEDENVPSGEDILKMLENSDGIVFDESEEGGKEPVEIVSTDRNGNLRNFLYDGENFTVYRNGSNTVFANSYDGKIIRKTFDENIRLSKAEVFTVGKSAREYSLKSEKKYYYDGDSFVVQKCIEVRNKNLRTETLFNSDRSVASVLESHVDEDGKIVDDKRRSVSYDEKSRIKEEVLERWIYSNSEKSKESFNLITEKNVYDYHDEKGSAFPPDLTYYENGIIRMKQEFSSPSDYIQTMFFDGDVRVKVFYKNGVKTSEIIYVNNEEQRKRTFEY